MSETLRKIDNYHYKVRSKSNIHEWYDVTYDGVDLECTCPHHQFRKANCRHIQEVEYSALNTTQVRANVINAVDVTTCPFCDADNTVKSGKRKNRNYEVQIYQCKECKRKFSTNIGFKGMGASPQIITNSLQLYFTGESLRSIQKFLELQGVRVTHKTVWNWINKYVKLMDKYLETIRPNVSDTWRTDELYLKISGNRKYLYSMMDDKTRFWIARQVSDTKYTEDVRPLFKNSKEIAGKQPKTLISDGARNFMEAHKKEWYTRYKEQQTEHIRHVHFKGDYNNNKMERMNGEIRDREKTMRGLKIMDSPIILGMQIYHNYIRSHMGIRNDTPAERAGIYVQGDNKWLTIIRNSQ